MNKNCFVIITIIIIIYNLCLYFYFYIIIIIVIVGVIELIIVKTLEMWIYIKYLDIWRCIYIQNAFVQHIFITLK